jgi:hypothetical protein
MTDKIKALTSSGRAQDRAGLLRNVITECVYEHGENMPVAAVIGVLEIVKLELMSAQEDME